MHCTADVHDLQLLTGALKAVANPTRLKILCLLRSGEQKVGAIADELGIGRSETSRHLTRLRDQGLTEARRDGQSVYYCLAGHTGARLAEAIGALYCATPPSRV